MVDKSNEKRKAVPQYELDARALEEKTARLRAQRLAHEAATGVTTAAPIKVRRASSGSKKAAGKGPDGKSSQNLAEWLASQEKSGHRS
jgi:hypothetical protein